MDVICAGCGKEIPADHTHLGGLHGTVCMGCEFSTLSVFKVEHDGDFYIDRDFNGVRAIIECMENGDSYTVSREEMRLTEYLSLPEFDGF